MADCLIDCINKQPRDDSHQGITHVGGPGGNQRWRLPRADVVASIEAGTNTFYTQSGGRRANVGVVDGTHSKYLRTYADGIWTDNLLALDECA